MRSFESDNYVQLLFVGALLLSSSCRSLNPKFLSEQQGDTQGGSTFRESKAQETTSQEEESEGESENSDSTQSTKGSKTSTTQSSSPSATTDTTASETSASSQQSDSSAPVSVCAGKATYCYAMNYDAAAKSYPDSNGQGPAMEWVQGEGTLSHQEDGGSVLFADYLLVDDGGRVRINTSVKTGNDGLFGFDVTMRNIRCSPTSACYLALAGNLVLQFDPVAKEMRCLSFSGINESGRATALMDPQGTNKVACFAQDNQIYLFVNGQSVKGSRPNPTTTLDTLRFNVGASTVTTSNPAVFSGDIGRFRYWTDTQAMVRVVKDEN